MRERGFVAKVILLIIAQDFGEAGGDTALMGKKILAAMSGGVDSSVAVRMLQEKGYEVAGGTMKMLAGADEELRVERTKRLAEQLGIELFVFPVEEEFRKGVIEYFADTYIGGGTPNPCVMCNRLFKFGYFLDKALELGFDGIATGHYAKICGDDEGRYRLKCSEDLKKDQSYFLFGMTQKELARAIFPLEAAGKEQVRQIAAGLGLDNAAQKDSQDICFVKGCLYTDVIDEVCRARGDERRKGHFVDVEGNVLGQHNGIERYTVGQRKGVGVSLGAGKPLYVVDKRPDTCEVVMGDDSLLFEKELAAKNISLVYLTEPEAKEMSPMKLTVKTRYNQKPLEASVYFEDIGAGFGARVIFDQPVRAITPGQFAVFYDGEDVIGGGEIQLYKRKKA